MGIKELVVIVLFVLLLDFVIILWLRKRGRQQVSREKDRFQGVNLPFLIHFNYPKPPERKHPLQNEVPLNGIRESNKGSSDQGNIWKPLRFLAHAPNTQPGSGINVRLPNTQWIEILIMVLVALIYAYSMLIFSPGLGLPGNEYQAHVGGAVLFNRWLAGEGDFPLWNPTLGTGRSLIADPFLFVFNPFLSLPMAIFGVVNGSKVAVLLNFFIAGLGMWLLARELKFSRLTRLWCSLLYMMSGAIPAHLYAGHLQLAFALAWLPWSIAGLFWTINRPSRISLLSASLAQALFFFTGNLYYQVYTFFCMIILGISYTIDWKNLRFKGQVAKRVLLMGIFSICLISIQLLPEIASRSDIHNQGGYSPNETEFHGSQRPENAIVNFFISDLGFYKNSTLGKAPYPQESYRYIGIAPFLLFLFLIPTFQHGNRKQIITFLLCFLLMLAWTDIRYSFIKTLYNTLPFLNQFRWPGRALSVGALFLILLSGYCLDHVFVILRRRSSLGEISFTSGSTKTETLTYSPVIVIVLMGLLLSTRQVFVKNQELIYLDKVIEPEVQFCLTWLRNNEPGELLVYTTGSIANRSALEFYKLQLRSPTIVDGWIPMRSPLGLGSPGLINIEPKYTLSWLWDDIDHSNHDSVKQIGALQIWQNENTFPYAFQVPIEYLLSIAQLNPLQIHPVISAERLDANRIVVEVEATEESVLILSESWFSGWKVRVDRQPAEVTSVSNLLAVKIPPGRHRVEFRYSPISFTLGALISGLSLLMVVIVISWESYKKFTNHHPRVDEG